MDAIQPKVRCSTVKIKAPSCSPLPLTIACENGRPCRMEELYGNFFYRKEVQIITVATTFRSSLTHNTLKWITCNMDGQFDFKSYCNVGDLKH